jgi:hypothetical protein
MDWCPAVSEVCGSVKQEFIENLSTFFEHNMREEKKIKYSCFTRRILYSNQSTVLWSQQHTCCSYCVVLYFLGNRNGEGGIHKREQEREGEKRKKYFYFLFMLPGIERFTCGFGSPPGFSADCLLSLTWGSLLLCSWVVRVHGSGIAVLKFSIILVQFVNSFVFLVQFVNSFVFCSQSVFVCFIWLSE